MTNDKPEPPKPDWALSNRERKAQAALAEGRRPPRRKWPWVVLALIALGVGGYVASERGVLPLPETAPETAGTEPAAPAAEDAPETVMQLLPRELTEIAPQTLRETVRMTGSLEPNRHLDIPAEVSGRIDEVAKRPGDPVEEGEVLVRIALKSLQNQLEQSQATADATRAQLEFARSELARTRSLVERGAASSSTLDSNESSVRQLEANLLALEQQVSDAQEALDKATIEAPFAGTIEQRNIDPGAYVSPGATLLTLVDISSLELKGGIPVNYAPRVRTGQEVEISVDGFGDRTFVGKVERVAPVAASGTRILPIYATIDNPDEVLRGGMFASGILVLEEKPDAIGIPAEALRKDGEGDYVLRRDGDRVVRQPVRIARMWDRGRVAEIAEGLSEGDVIVSAALDRLRSGMKISLVEG